MHGKTRDAYEIIKRNIIVGTISNREPISVGGLANDLGMSRTPVRDALQKLQTEGFVRIIPNQGIEVQELTVSEVAQMYEFRIAVEEYLLKKSIHIIKKEDISHLRLLIDKQKKAMDEDNPFDFMKYDNEQHLYIHNIYYNPIIFNVVNQMIERIFYGGVQALRLPGRMQAVLEEHVRLVDALEEQDLEKAYQALEAHFNKGLSSTTFSVQQSTSKQHHS